jgi:hypothetical protein
MKRKLLFSLVAALLLTPWGVAYAYDEVNASNIPLTIEQADPALAPNINVVGNAIGGVTAGDLFQIDTSGTTTDTLFTLYFTNLDELVHSYRYMTLNIGIYVQTNINEWEKATTIAGETFPDIYITMQGGLVSFTLPGASKYKITIDKGCFYSYGATPNKSAAIPRFYITTSQ